MRIIDTNKDYYDFYQHIYRDNSIVFDRRDSYNLSKEEFAKQFNYDWDSSRRYRYFGKWFSRNNDVLLQICNTFWLFDLEVIKTDDSRICTDYKLRLICTWKDYAKKSEIIKLSHITFRYYSIDSATKKIDAIRTDDYKTQATFDKFYVSRSNGSSNDIREEKHIPILQNIGIASIVAPLDIYLALEEYFASQKTAFERTESKNLTNNEKVTNHGFDLKKSFRGK